LAIALAPQACSQQNHLAAAGESCFLANDCEPGLVCVPRQDGTRICTDDLANIAGQGPQEAGPADANPDARDGGRRDGANDAPADSPPVDTGTDTGTDTGAG
jgi:hypothetical protein